ncbi:Protein CBG06379 [Caenorhabditis briggsae]|uniref:Protein CBG06379 n=2 Tax=Caenorhabditis briggsae TaxID=6238 RepID=A8X237_CAEBR|nr:Protein CBG06379 [Caenorhabditis briggsae]ULT87915.1 hypothetical protein L3Y34_007236 [Caenorhabditis briggsae]CAP26697.2 Protein CBG06379 [Caenorhabditis briggsae]
MQKLCQICGADAHGLHFGAISCRACSAFFRRALLSKKLRKTCKNENLCTDFSGLKTPACKICRMRKCIKMGMKPQTLQKVSRSVEIFVGRPNMVLFTTNTIKKRNYVDVKNLVAAAFEILKFGAPTPLSNNLSQLERMSLEVTYSTGKCQKLDTICKNSFSEVWKFDFLTAAKWLTQLEEFTMLPMKIQMQLLQAIWSVFGRIYKSGKTVELRKTQGENSRTMNLSDKHYVEMENTKIDMSWLSPYPFEQIMAFFCAGSDACETHMMIEDIAKMELSEIELTYMTAQLCFQYAETRFAGTELSGICDRFLKILANDLHEYYMSDTFGNRNYASRIMKMMKINQHLQRAIRLQREKTLIAHTFDIFIADFSHPEMFVDSGC